MTDASHTNDNRETGDSAKPIVEENDETRGGKSKPATHRDGRKEGSSDSAEPIVEENDETRGRK